MSQPPDRGPSDASAPAVGARRLQLVPSRPAAKSHITEHLANERTYLAYLRTSVSLISFGVTINRFSLFLIQSHLLSPTTHIGLSGVGRLGLGMVILGISVLLFAAYHFNRISTAIERQDYQPKSLVIWIITAAVLLGGATSLVWLFTR